MRIEILTKINVIFFMLWLIVGAFGIWMRMNPYMLLCLGLIILAMYGIFLFGCERRCFL